MEKWIPGLVSISFRDRSARQITKLVKDNGLRAIEWGGDVHVPAGDTAVAAQVAADMHTAGLAAPEYGAYYKLGKSDPDEIQRVIACARTLGTKVIRLWAYVKSYSDCTPEEYANAVADAKRICDLAPELQFALECHNWSLTEDYRDALRYLKDVDRTNLKMFWQPNQFRSHAYNLEACRALLPYIVAVHVFSWESADGKTVMYPLEHHADRWAAYLEILKDAPVERLPLMLEFMHDGKAETLPQTARTLLQWLQ